MELEHMAFDRAAPAVELVHIVGQCGVEDDRAN